MKEDQQHEEAEEQPHRDVHEGRRQVELHAQKP
jgi:hypothetical protein